ncbi:MAG: MBL fold metallo-hydrolase [Firmicutes bacterium]|nr:MBL fold metallo-hydrolase [Bacillota bacterium]
MATVSFWGGIGVIGSSKILIEQDGWRVLLDFGLDFTPGRGLFRGPVSPRPGHALKDRLRTGGAPWLPHLYRPEAVQGLDLPGGSDGRTALFITHAHLDHIGLTGWVDPAVPLYCSPDTQRLMEALAQSGQDVEGGHPRFQVIPDGGTIAFGPFRVTRYPVDHDVIGASGYAVETDDGILAFTGDIRLHGRHPELSLAFADAVHGARALVIEGTTLSQGFQHITIPESEVDRRFASALAQTPGLVMMTLYPRNIERVTAFLALAQNQGRRILWPEPTARFLRALGLQPIDSLADTGLDEIVAHPEGYVVQMALDELPLLLDLPTGPGSVFLHANGEPLGPFDPAWEVLQDWLKWTHTPFWPIGTGGHASPDDLHRLVEWVAPEIVFPLHSQEPDRLIPPPGTVRWLPERGGRRYPLSGRSRRGTP